MKLGYILIAAALPVFAGCSDSSNNASQTPPKTPQTVAQVPSQTKALLGKTAPATPAEKTGTSPEEASVVQSINTNLGDASAYRKVFERLQQGVKSGDKQAVASLVSYPIGVTIDGKPRTIQDAQTFIKLWDKIITPDIAQVITTQRFGDLFVNWQGVMLGDGQVWLNGICHDEACKVSDVRIITIQSEPSVQDTPPDQK